VAAERRIALRIGINLGDVIVEPDGDLMGDGVNIAARLEGFAEPGSICLSRAAYDQVRGKVDAAFVDLGEQSLKNIAETVRVWCWTQSRSAGAPAAVADAPLPLPDKPSIAVLPFANMSGDPEQEYFADGMVEDIITALSRFRYLFVIARNSSFTYKGRAVDVKQVGRELGVRYVLEGSVRKAGNRVRITGQLIEAASGAHIWADRVDGALEDVFALQDQVTASVVAVIAPKLRSAEIERVRRKPTESLQAYDFFLKALSHVHETERASLAEGIRLADAAITLDPRYAIALAVKARMLYRRMVLRHVPPDDPSVVEAVVLARRAATLAPEDPDVLWLAAFVIGLGGGDFATALELVDRSLALNPNAADALVTSGLLGSYRGDAARALPHLERAARLNPLSNDSYIIFHSRARLYFVAGEYPQAVEWADKSLRLLPGHLSSLVLKIAALGHLGRSEEGRAAVDSLLAVSPTESVATQRQQYARMFGDAAVLASFLEGLRKAGLPVGAA
jgi:adenylate cyclase